MGGWLDTHTCVFHPSILPRISSNGSAPFATNPHLKPNWTNNISHCPMEAFAWDLSLGNFCLGSSGLGNWSPEAGGTGGGTGSPDSVFEILSKNPSSEPSKGTIAKDKLQNIHE